MKNKGAFVITGATGGLGGAIAYAAYGAGFPVALIARDKSELRQLKKDIQKKYPRGSQVSIHDVDLTHEKNVAHEFSSIEASHGSVRALINCAGTWMGTTSVEAVKAEEVRRSLELNFFSAFNATSATLRLTGAKPKQELAIINIGATASLDAWIEVLPFCIAKGALRDYSRALARDLGPKGVHVAHLVIDGMLDGERTRRLNRSLPKNRFIRNESVAQSVLHVALQERSCWTMEWDVRPYNENW